MKRVAIVLIICFITSITWSQNNNLNNDTESTPVLLSRKNCVFGELGGKGILGSINYERVLPFAENNGLSLGASVGFLLDFASDISYVIGEGNHFAEFGTAYSFPGNILIPHIGYRFQGNSVFLFKAVPMYFISLVPESFGDFFWGGISFGYTF